MAEEDLADLLLSDDMDESNRAIQAMHGTFNREVVMHALIDAEKSLQSALEIKKQLDEKAFWFLKFLVPLATLLLGYFIINFNDLNDIVGSVNKLRVGIIILYVIFIVFVPIIYFVFCLAISRDYVSLGRYPDTWLRKGVIDSDDENVYVTNLVFILRDLQEGLIINTKSNMQKETAIQHGISFILFGILMMPVGLGITSLIQPLIS